MLAGKMDGDMGVWMKPPWMEGRVSPQLKSCLWGSFRSDLEEEVRLACTWYEVAQDRAKWRDKIQTLLVHT